MPRDELPKRIPSNVVPHDVLAGPASVVVAGEALAASTSAFDSRILFAWPPPLRVALAVSRRMMEARRNNIEISLTVISLDAVAVMHDLTLENWAAKHLLCLNNMLVNIATRIGAVMLRHLQENVAIRGNRSSTLPTCAISPALIVHGSILTRGVLQHE